MAGSIGPVASLMFACVALATMHLVPALLANRLDLGPHSTKFVKSRSLHRVEVFKTWSAALFTSSLLILVTILTSNLGVTMVTMALVGVSWAVCNWAPFTLIGEEVASAAVDFKLRLEGCGLEKGADEQYMDGGSVSGIHNMAISGPQILAAGISSIYMWTAQKMGDPDGQAWVLRGGGVAHFVAAVLCLRYVNAKKARQVWFWCDVIS